MTDPYDYLEKPVISSYDRVFPNIQKLFYNKILYLSMLTNLLNHLISAPEMNIYLQLYKDHHDNILLFEKDFVSGCRRKYYTPKIIP